MIINEKKREVAKLWTLAFQQSENQRKRKKDKYLHLIWEPRKEHEGESDTNRY